jgi:hypothetical protein
MARLEATTGAQPQPRLESVQGEENEQLDSGFKM